MFSWKLFRRLTNYWAAIDNPVFARETQRAPLWQHVASRMAQSSGLLVVLTGVLCYLSTVIAYYAQTLLVLFVPLIILWTLLLSLTMAPVVVREREEQTWQTLRTTPMELDSIMLGKAAGALWWLRHLMRALIGLTLIGAIAVGIGSLVFVSFEDEMLSTLPVPLICGLTVALPMVSSTLFLVDRAQQMMLAALCGLAISAQSRTVRLAAPLAVTIALLVTALDMAVGLLVLTQLEQITTPLHELGLLLLLFGPAVVYLAELPFWVAVGVALLTLLAREGAIWLGWQWTLRAARQP